MNITKTIDINELHDMKQQYFELATSPLDGMWHFGFVPLAQHFSFFENNELVGFCCVNEDGFLLQFYVSPCASSSPCELFNLIVGGLCSPLEQVKGAYVSTSEPQYLSLCLDLNASTEVLALTFTHRIDWPHATFKMVLATQKDINLVTDFSAQNTGMEPSWLQDYYKNLIDRKELWCFREDGNVLALGECRFFDSLQTDIADLGVIVEQAERGQGIATGVLRFLSRYALSCNCKPICSTEATNTPAQKAIKNAGFYSHNRILKVLFLNKLHLGSE